MTDVSELLCLIIETVLAVKEKFKAEHIVDILKGNETSEVTSYKHHELESFGAAPDVDESMIHAVIRQAMLEGYILKDIETYGVLKITPQGKHFLKKPQPFKIPVEDQDEDDEDAMAKSAVSCSAADDVLFSILKDLRKKMSKKLEVPPFVIFQDPSLEAMATSYPITLEELQNIPGVGAGKAKKYGAEFISLIKSYVQENDIIRPEDLRVKTVAKKSQLKVSIIQAIDRKVDLDDLALSKGLDIYELLTEIEAIVYSGTKINIDYFLEEIMDADKEEEIFEYFKTAETDNVEAALEELGEDDFSEIDVRLVRIKFLSEIGN